MRLFMESARRCRGALIGGIVGLRDVDSADDWMLSEGVRNPSRVVAMLMPGFPEQD
jgi:hypothetical protein